MKLVKTKNSEGEKRTCLINEIANGGDYTACSIAIDSTIRNEGHEWTNEKPAKKPTCPECIEIIRWWKRIKI